MKKTELRQIIKEELKFLLEKESYSKYLKLLGYDPIKFKKLDSHAYTYYMNAYKKSLDVNEFEQNYLDDLERDVTKIKLENKINEGYYFEKDILNAIKKAEAETGKKLKIPIQVKKDIQWMQKLGYTKGKVEDILLHFYNSLGDKKFKIDTGNPVLDKLKGNYLYSLFLGSYNALFMESNYIASKVIKHLIDKKNNNEEIEDAYSETKEYFKSFGKDYKNNRVFEWSANRVKEWMKTNLK